MPGGNRTGPLGQGPGSGRGMRGGERQPAQGAGNSDLLVNTVGTLVLTLGAIVFRKLARKLKSSPEKDVTTENEKKSEN